MSDGVKRTVRLGSMAFIDPSGRTRRADCGAEIEIHPDHAERFDRLNVLPGESREEAPTAPVKRRPGRPRKET